MERGEQSSGEVVRVDAGRELPVGMKGSESIADCGCPLIEPCRDERSGLGVKRLPTCSTQALLWQGFEIAPLLPEPTLRQAVRRPKFAQLRPACRISPGQRTKRGSNIDANRARPLLGGMPALPDGGRPGVGFPTWRWPPRSACPTCGSSSSRRLGHSSARFHRCGKGRRCTGSAPVPSVGARGDRRPQRGVGRGLLRPLRSR